MAATRAQRSTPRLESRYVIVVTEFGRLTLCAYPVHDLLRSGDPARRPAGAAAGRDRRERKAA